MSYLNAQISPKFEWAKQFRGESFFYDESICLDSSGSIYSIGSFDLFILPKFTVHFSIYERC